jgi:hypothetical protein
MLGFSPPAQDRYGGEGGEWGIVRLSRAIVVATWRQWLQDSPAALKLGGFADNKKMPGKVGE